MVHKNPTDEATRRDVLRSRLESKTHRCATGCWIYTGSKVKFGYGRIRMRAKDSMPIAYPTHRLSYELNVGPVPDGLYVLHRCDNPPCVRPDHLFVGTHLENIQDSVSKGRNTAPRGEASQFTRLSAGDIREMRSAHRSGAELADLAQRFGVHASHVSRVVRREAWKHLSDKEHTVQFIKSSKCGNVDNCVEVGFGSDLVKVRDSKTPEGSVLVFSYPEWGAFIAGAKAGEFDSRPQDRERDEDELRIVTSDEPVPAPA